MSESGHRPSLLLPRRATLKAKTPDQRDDTRTMDAWQDTFAYVLLGDPGAGKSTAFEQEATRVSGARLLASAVSGGYAAAIEPGQTVFIDALDEARINNTLAIDGICKWLKEQGAPSFRLSCREADWQATGDKQALTSILGTREIAVLHLEDLSDDDIAAIIQSKRPNWDVAAFKTAVIDLGMGAMLNNPNLLTMLLDSAPSLDDLPRSKGEAFERMCRMAASEQSAIRDERKPQGAHDTDNALSDAGALSAVLLLSGQDHISKSPVAIDAIHAQGVVLRDLPPGLCHAASAATQTALFTSSGNQVRPRHRTVAEYLAATELNRRIEAGLPLGRVLALLCGFDGKPLDPLRGIFGWLSVHSLNHRDKLLQIDPLAALIHADICTFSPSSLKALLESLQQLAETDPWAFRNSWQISAWGSMATPELAVLFVNELALVATEPKRQMFQGILLRALAQSARPMTQIVDTAIRWVEDNSAPSDHRVSAFEAWRLHAGLQPTQALSWLEQLKDGRLSDDSENLVATILVDLFPSHVPAGQLLAYLPKHKRASSTNMWPRFWYALHEYLTHQQLGEMLDTWALYVQQGAGYQQGHRVKRFANKLLVKLFAELDSNVNPHRALNWLKVGLDEYGFNALDGDAAKSVWRWMENHPQLLLAIAHEAYARQLEMDPSLSALRKVRWLWDRYPWPHELIDECDWLMAQARLLNEDRFVKHATQLCARKIEDRFKQGETPHELTHRLENFVRDLQEAHPQAPDWLANEWTTSLEGDWQQEDHARRLQLRAEEAKQQAQLLAQAQTELQAAKTRPVAFWFLGSFASEYLDKGQLENGEPDTHAALRYVGGNKELFDETIDQLELLLARPDLPTEASLLETHAQGNYQQVQPALSLAAQLAHQKQSQWALDLPSQSVRLLVINLLTDGFRNTPQWFIDLLKLRGADAAPAWIEHAALQLKTRANGMHTELGLLKTPEIGAILAPLVLPNLIARFPTHPSADAMRELTRGIIPALKWLKPEQAKQIIRSQLERNGQLTAWQIAWRTALMRYDTAQTDALIQLVGQNETRQLALAEELGQFDLLKDKGLDSSTAARLVQSLGQLIKPFDYAQTGYSRMDPKTHDIQQTVTSLLRAALPGTQAPDAQILKSLQTDPTLQAWRPSIDHLAAEQVREWRQSSYAPPSPAGVAHALLNQKPAHAQDLLALAIDQLAGLIHHIHTGDTTPIRQFWTDHTSDGRKPKRENECRDLLLERLCPLLSPLGVDCQTEAVHAHDKRVDIRLSCRVDGQRIELPIEIKIADHKNLWTAAKDQLERLYMAAQQANPCGLYLVLWFGLRHQTHPEGKKAKTPQELQTLLEARIAPEQRATLRVMVADLAWNNETSKETKARLKIESAATRPIEIQKTR